MKTAIKIFCFTVLFVLFIQIEYFPQSFEGKVNIKLVSDGDVSFIDYLIKGNTFRMEMKDEEGESTASIIMDMNEMKMITLMTEDKMYMEYPLEQTMEENENDDSDGEIEEVRITNETREINGFNCQKLIYEDKENMEAWATTDIGNFMFYESPMGGSGIPEWYLAFSDAGFFPILVIEKDDSGEEESRWEVTSVEKKSLSEDLFVPPADYEKMEIPMMDFLK